MQLHSHCRFLCFKQALLAAQVADAALHKMRAAQEVSAAAEQAAAQVQERAAAAEQENTETL